MLSPNENFQSSTEEKDSSAQQTDTALPNAVLGATPAPADTIPNQTTENGNDPEKLKRKSQYVTQTGIDLIGDVLVPNIELSYDLPNDDEPIGFGQSVTPGAAKEMIRRAMVKNVKGILEDTKRQRLSDDETLDYVVKKLKEDKISVDFGKESILRILAQTGCEGIRLTLCQNLKEEYSLVAMGIVSEKGPNSKTIVVPYKKNYYHDAKSKPKPATGNYSEVPQDALAPMTDEQGVGSSFKVMMDILGITEKDLIDMITKSIPLEGSNKEQIEESISNKIIEALFPKA